jgi:pimeloyl-ACP methyl ester carboxylesterase
MPTLIVWGDSDPIIPIQHGIDAHAAIRGSRLEIFEGVGHFPHCEDPDRFVRVLTDFIRDTPAATAITPERWKELLTRPLST